MILTTGTAGGFLFQKKQDRILSCFFFYRFLIESVGTPLPGARFPYPSWLRRAAFSQEKVFLSPPERPGRNEGESKNPFLSQRGRGSFDALRLLRMTCGWTKVHSLNVGALAAPLQL